MPCHTDGPTQEEIDTGALNMLLDEVFGEAPGKRRDPHLNDWARHVNQRRSWSNDRRTRELCRWCRQHASSLKQKSLELQIWWRDHQRVDLERQVEAKQKASVLRLRRQALRKLTPAERQAVMVKMS